MRVFTGYQEDQLLDMDFGPRRTWSPIMTAINKNRKLAGIVDWVFA
jgi:hypothetical protein